MPWDEVRDLDARFGTTGWWHSPTTHVYVSPVGEGLWELAARAWHDPAVHSASKVSWGVPVANEHVESHFTVGHPTSSYLSRRQELATQRRVFSALTMLTKEYIPPIREALARVPAGGWREFAAFAGPELGTLTAWGQRVVLVGDSSHALSGAFGSGAGFAMEDGWVLAQALALCRRDRRRRALDLFAAVRLPYYARMYAHLGAEAARRAARLAEIRRAEGRPPSFDERVANKVIHDGGADMSWIYEHDVGATWREFVKVLGEVGE